LDEGRLQRMISNEQVNGNKVYTAVEMMNDLRKGIFEELYRSQKVDAYRRNIQRAYVDAAAEYVQNLKKEENNDVTSTDVIALMRGDLEQLRRDLRARRNRTNDQLSVYHWNDLIARIDNALSVDA
ncbi:MAG: zinc-dependent metalloprotease, partial [Salegentibacter sp.]|uniref:zinc-dependent metalloprotease n=1 Tax=Salegentibacter sp. TaxID=1903072 RepID=UPI00286FC15F